MLVLLLIFVNQTFKIGLKLKYSDSTWYNKVYDFIEIDYPRDYVVTRRNGMRNDVVVTFPASPL
jgi:hypothetical protein